ncbi:copper amine oxidase N-terminal domain-containing protein [Paenibacillus dokdonensis]|uniref:Copper amine oxidase N-terminal domain-containing protein n=1 Tax=Paenibacillus dokdonensis TaxID=2567944 RepID=A0ABU6GXC8_9BACL|nr:copper amine oxidase N-terminal domain-containing protein [Paenibacillus dokdonensis]MEC0242842.1 copper amine oxidase N-terminal domain-containing protein [Paenibacillus dokdonensis]
MKKIISLVIIFLCSVIGVTTTSAAADAKESPIIVENGKIMNGRTLIPIRVVAAHFGFQVDWNQESKTVTIGDKDSNMALKLNSKQAVVNGKEVILDAPAQIVDGVTYVPLKFVGDAFGAGISWDQTFKAAHVQLAEADLLIYTQIKPIPKLTADQLYLFSQIANKAAVITDSHQAKVYFKPYLTDPLLGNIIWYKGLPFKTQFDSKNQGYVTYGNMYNSEATILQNTHFATLVWLSRTMQLKYVDHSWKIDKIDFKYIYF